MNLDAVADEEAEIETRGAPQFPISGSDSGAIQELIYLQARYKRLVTLGVFRNESMRFYGIVVSCLLLTGCVTAPPLNFAVGNVPRSPNKVDADLRSITVVLAQDDEKTGRIASDGEKAVEPFKEALTDAVNRAALFTDDSHTHVNLAVKFLKINPPHPGFDMETDVEARYEITDRRTGAPIYNKQFTSVGLCPMDFAFAGEVRARESVNRAFKANLDDFITDMEAAKIVATGAPSS
jgi:hypothetical protein